MVHCKQLCFIEKVASDVDKYELNLKIDEIKRLASIKSYEEAAKIAKNMSWHKVKDWSALAAAISVHEAVGDYEEARDMAILAYNRNLGGRKLVYKLTELLIKLRQFDDAEGLYDEYVKMSQHDVNKFILQYNLRKAEGASDNELVEILEEYKAKEIDEKYMYELAKLYARTGRTNECIEACDELALLFQDGIYVEKAMQLKTKVGGELSKHQTKMLEIAKIKSKDESTAKEQLFEQQAELTRIQHDDVEEVLEEDEKKSKGILGLFSKSAPKDMPKEEIDVYEKIAEQESNAQSDLPNETVRGYADSKQKPNLDAKAEHEEPLETSAAGNNAVFNLREFVLAKVRESEEKRAREQREQLETLDVQEQESDTETAKDTYDTEDIEEEQEEAQISASASTEAQEPQTSQADKAASEIPESLMKLISNAKKSIDTSYNEMSKEHAQERIHEEHQGQELFNQEHEENMTYEDDMIIDDVQLPVNNIYDTQDLQDTIAQSLAEFLNEDNKSFAQPDTVEMDSDADLESPQDNDQIEGQMNLSDWMASVKEKKYGTQSTKEFSKQELVRMLDEKEEKSAAYERLIQKQKEEAKKAINDIDADEERKKAYIQMIVNSVKTDLAIRTGKAEQKLEDAVIKLRDSNDVRIPPSKRDNTVKKVSSTADTEISEVPLHTIQMETISDEILRKYVVEELDNIAKQQTQNKDAKQTEKAEIIQETKQTEEPEIIQETSQTEEPEIIQENEEPIVLAQESRKVRKPQMINPIADDEEEDVEDQLHLEGELAKIFRKYREMPGVESQLATYFASIDDEMDMLDSSVGNILITGNSSSDKTDLARNIVRALNYLYPDVPKKIAKTTGDSINNRGIAKAMPKLRGTVLIVEGAGSIQPKRIEELMKCLEQNTRRMIVIFEDSDAQMNVLLNFNPGLTRMFNHRIVLKQYTVNELVEMARKFARKRQYEVDDDALLALYLKINELHSMTDNIKLDDVKEIINKAIAHSEKRAARRFFGGVKKKRGEKGDIFFLSESDFKD